MEPGVASTPRRRHSGGVTACDDHRLIRVRDVDARICVDLRYASERNFSGRVLYRSPEAWLRPGTAQRLRRAQDALQRIASGHRLLLLDAYRPPSAQEALWRAYPDPTFVAPPDRGSRHTRGTAVDVTLVDPLGREVEMPSGFDEFGERAGRDWAGASELAARHLRWLTEAMVGVGFRIIRSEWWHYDDPDWESCPLLTWEPPGG